MVASSYSIPTAVSGESFISLTDFGTIRGRIGWATGSLLPYVSAGVALGRASYGTTATLYQNAAICVVADGTGHNQSLAERFGAHGRRIQVRFADLRLVGRPRHGLGADPQHLPARRIRVHPVLADEAQPQQRARRRRREVLIRPGDSDTFPPHCDRGA